MSGKNIFFAICLFCSLYCWVACSDKDNPIVEKKFARMELNAFGVDAYRFRVSLSNDMVVTDSLLTPDGKISKDVFFDDFSQRIRVYNTADETVLVDTPYTLRVGKANVFTIYQTQANTTPFFLAPPPTEPAAKPGNTKLSIIWSATIPPDSAKIVIEEQTGASYKPADSVVLKKDIFSRYLEFAARKNIRVRFYEVTGSNKPIAERLIDTASLNEDFTIYQLKRVGTTSVSAQKLY